MFETQLFIQAYGSQYVFPRQHKCIFLRYKFLLYIELSRPLAYFPNISNQNSKISCIFLLREQFKLLSLFSTLPLFCFCLYLQLNTCSFTLACVILVFLFSSVSIFMYMKLFPTPPNISKH